MRLNGEIARRIVDRVAAGMDKQVYVVDSAGSILASSDGRLIGLQLSPAAPALVGTEIIEYADHQLVGIGLPLVYADTVVGTIVLNDPSPVGRELGRVAKTLAELIIHQMNVIEHLPHQKWVRDKFVSDLLHERYHGSAEDMLEEAELLGIDLRVPRLVVVITLEPISDRQISPAIPGDSLPRIARALRLEDDDPELLATLDAFLHASLSPSATAHTLHIHRHTLAYRLDKITHLTGLDPREFTAAGQFYAALVLRKTSACSD